MVQYRFIFFNYKVLLIIDTIKFFPYTYVYRILKI